jgi:hypothetical protein
MRALWLKRLGWLVLIWCLSVGALGVAALAMRWVMNAAGLNR